MVRWVLFFLTVAVTESGVGQALEFKNPERLTDAVNSRDEESLPLLSPDGKTLYFARSMHEGNRGGKYSGQDVWISKFENGLWRNALNSTFPFNTKNNNAVIGISADGKTLYLIDGSLTKKIKGISFTKNIKGVWTEPESIPLTGLDNESFIGFFVSPTFDVILISMKGKDSRGEEDLYVSLKQPSGEWSKPKNLGPTINTTGFEISPFLSSDKKRLFFSSNGHPGLGDADIFYSDRLYDSWETWSTPKNLGKSINSEKFEGYFSSMKDSLFIFSSNREGKFSDLYWTTILDVPKAGLKQERIFLETREVESIFGSTPESIDLSTSSELTLSQSNRLRKLADVLREKKDLKIHLVTRTSKTEEELEANKDRLFIILNQLKNFGIEGSRVTFGSGTDSVIPDGVVAFKFYY